MAINDQYNILLKMFKPHLKLYDFKYKKPMFYCRQGDNFGMISFQKSMYSTKHDISFTINIGVSSKVLFDYSQSNLKEFKPSFSYSCWDERLGFLTEYHKDIWWSFGETTDIQLLF